MTIRAGLQSAPKEEEAMINAFKDIVMTKGMDLIQSQAVGKLMESEKVGFVIEKAMSVPFKVSGALMSQKERLVALLDLATQEDVDEVKRAVSRMEGILRDIKKESRAPIVIMITNYPYRQYRQGSMAAGADYFFSKINEFDMIRETLSGIGLDHQDKIHHSR